MPKWSNLQGIYAIFLEKKEMLKQVQHDRMHANKFGMTHLIKKGTAAGVVPFGVVGYKNDLLEFIEDYITIVV
jgi:hypothetical protein